MSIITIGTVILCHVIVNTFFCDISMESSATFPHVSMKKNYHEPEPDPEPSPDPDREPNQIWKPQWFISGSCWGGGSCSAQRDQKGAKTIDRYRI